MIPPAVILALLIAAVSASAAEETSVLVETMMPQRGSLPDEIVAFGTATPALDGSMTVSLQSQGRVTRFLVTAGEAISAGQPLLDFAVSQSAIGNYQQAVTALAAAKTDRARLAQLRAQQLATKDQVTQADKAIADAQTTLQTLTRSGADKPDLTIKAPFDGVVSAIPIAQGDTVAPGAPMMTLMRADGLVVTVGIEPSQRLRLKIGDPAQLTPLTSGGAPSGGSVVRIDGLLNPKTHLIDADVATKAHLLPGAAFRAAITAGQFMGWVVPRDAVLRDAKGAYLFQVAALKAHRVDVTLVGSTDTQSVLSGPIDAASPFVTQGNYQLSDGMAVRLAPTSAATDPATR